MRDRMEVVSEYREMRLTLNRSNRRKNQRTDVRFSIEGEIQVILYAGLYGGSGQRLELARRPSNGFWRPSDFSGYLRLERFCCDFLNPRHELDAKDAAEALKVELETLGLTFEDPR